VGRDTWEASLDCLQTRGLMVSFGNASGPVTGVNLGILATKGSLYVTRPTLASYMTTPEMAAEAADDLFARVRAGDVKPMIEQRYALRDAAEAHRALEARQTTGATVFTLNRACSAAKNVCPAVSGEAHVVQSRYGAAK